MSKISNLRKVTKKLKGHKLKRVAEILHDYGIHEFFRRLREKMEHGDTLRSVDQRVNLITNESFIKNPSDPVGFHCEQEVSFMTRPVSSNFGRIDVLTQNATGTGTLKMIVRNHYGTVVLSACTSDVAHNGYTTFAFLPILRNVQKPYHFTFISDTIGCGVLVDRKKQRSGTKVVGKGTVVYKLYLKHDALYLHWMSCNNLTQRELLLQRAHTFEYSPKFSVLVPLYNTPENFLREMIDSVLAQTYTNWELCLADGSTQPLALENIVSSYNDKRIIYRKLDENMGISGNSNEAIKMATGEYVALLDHDDLLMPHALYANAAMLNKHRDYEFIYSDEDKISEDGSYRFDPFFKPDFSPDVLNSFNYITHLAVIKKSLLDEVGGFRDEFNGAQDYDLFLRLCEKAKRIGHITDILYHWRVSEGSTAFSSDAKNYTVSAGKAAVEGSLARRGITNAHVANSQFPNYYVVSYDVPTPHPLISIIIPNHDAKKTLQKCIDSIIGKSTYDNYEIIIVENNSKKSETFAYYKKIQKNPRIHVLEWNHPFNYSALNNYAAQKAQGELLLFMNNDMSVISPDWLEQMASHACRPEIGQVGAKLYFPDDTIQHGGVVLKIGRVAGHSHKLFPKYHIGYFARLSLPNNVSAVTAACTMLRADIFRSVGGFDEQFTIAFNDVDLSLKIRDKGYYVIWTPFAELYHYESKTRGYEDTPEKIRRFEDEQALWIKKWDAKYPYDPFYNPNLTNETEDYTISPKRRKYGNP
ncbi:MAG: glycosyltransferase family 2 protein [Christensenella sp.]